MISLPVLALPLRSQRYSCHGCGNCCRDFTVQLREEDLVKLASQQWVAKMGGPVTVSFRGVQYLRQREDGGCVFLMDDGLCRIHKDYGFEAKPIACQLFPFHLTPAARGGSGAIVAGLNYACQSVLENKGADLRSHAAELSRMAGELEELRGMPAPPMLTGRLRASAGEEKELIARIDDWLQQHELGLPTRLDGLAFIAQMLAKADFTRVREERFSELLGVLFGALPEELEHHAVAAPARRQMNLLRQAVFARVEDPKLTAIERRGRWRTTLDQLLRSRRFKAGRGMSPRVGGWGGGDGWTPVDLRAVERVQLADNAQQIEMIDDLLTRWLRATTLGGRAWGAGYYGWSMIDGLQALMLNVACVGWLARLHAAGADRQTLTIDDVRAALGRIDRTAGRAKWLGTSAERLRLAYLNMDDGLRRVVRALGCVDMTRSRGV